MEQETYTNTRFNENKELIYSRETARRALSVETLSRDPDAPIRDSLSSQGYILPTSIHKSPLPLTDPRDAGPQAHRVVHRCRRPVYHTDRPTKFTTPQPISLSREIVGAHQNLNGSCDPNHASFRDSLPSMALATVNLRIKFEVTLYLHSLRRYERRYKMSNWGVLGHSRSLEIAPMNRAHTSSIIMSLSCTVSDI